MRVGDPDHQRQLDVITQIPSNKVDEVDLSGLTQQEMDEYESQHEKDLRAQVRAYDETDLRIVAEEIVNIGWTHLYNVLGDYFEKLYNQMQEIKKIQE